jgi:MFS family permease
VHRYFTEVHRVVVPAAADTPAQRAGWGFILGYAAAYAGTWLAVLTPIMVTLALRTRELQPQNAEHWLSLVLAVGALFALVSNPIAGWLSDRTTSSWGMRRPWLVGGAVCGVLSLWLVAKAPSVGWLLVGWCLTQVSFNAVLAPLAALLPDHVPAERRGTVAGIIGITTPLGQVGGTYLTRALSGDMGAMLVVPAVVCLVLVVVLSASLPDRHLSREKAPPFEWSALFRSFRASPGRTPDFTWVCVGRFCLMMCMAFMMAYQPFFLMDRLKVAAADVPDIVFRATLVQSAAVVIAGLVAGRLSDFTRRRKPFVMMSAVACAAGALLAAGASSYDTFVLAVTIFGVGLGAFLSVDLALVTDVLPNKEDDAAKDLGLFNIASALPQSIAPGIASAILLQAGGYGSVFVAGGIMALIGAAAVAPVRSAR